jgi:hypothetical protein
VCGSRRGLAFAKGGLEISGRTAVSSRLDLKMELNPTEESDLNEPHFDEEATVLSARPVVPLKEIRTRENSKKRLAFGAAMLFSVMVGALGATLIFRQRGQKQMPVAVETEFPGIDGSANALDQTNASAKSIAEAGSGSVPAAEPAAITKSESATEVHKTPARVSASTEVAPIKAKRRASVANRDFAFEDEQDLRRAERIEARQMRRRAEWEEMREARRRRTGSEDLLRIRDIFEGPRRRH